MQFKWNQDFLFGVVQRIGQRTAEMLEELHAGYHVKYQQCSSVFNWN
jgi:hypothetical protein